MNNKITIPAKVLFDPRDMTNKHKKQASWKKMVLFDIRGEISEYYCAVIKKRYGLTLNPPLRRAHVTAVNDSVSSLGKGVDWDIIKKMYDRQSVEVTYNLDGIRTDGKHWWINCESNEALHLRRALGLEEKGFYGLHLTIGHANEKNVEHSRYIHDCIVKGHNYANHKRVQSLINQGILKYKDGSFQ